MLKSVQVLTTKPTPNFGYSRLQEARQQQQQILTTWLHRKWTMWVWPLEAAKWRGVR